MFAVLMDNKYYVYKNTNINDEQNVVKVYNMVDASGKSLEFEDIDLKIREDFQDYDYGFKHTYKKNDAGYYWYSTEFVKIK